MPVVGTGGDNFDPARDGGVRAEGAELVYTGIKVAYFTPYPPSEIFGRRSFLKTFPRRILVKNTLFLGRS